MKKLFIMLSILITLTLQLLATDSDPLWSKILPDDSYPGLSCFTNDDSLLIMKIYNNDSAYLGFFNTLTGELVRKMYQKPDSASKYIYNASCISSSSSEDKMAVFPVDTNLKVIHIINPKTGVLLDSINLNNDSLMNQEKNHLTDIRFSPDGSKLYGIFTWRNGVDAVNYPKYSGGYYVWNTNNWILEKCYLNKYDNYVVSSIKFSPNKKFFIAETQNTFSIRDIDSDYVIEKNNNLLYIDKDTVSDFQYYFPKTDTTRFMLIYYSKNRHNQFFQIWRQSDLTIEKEITNDTLWGSLTADFALGASYIVSDDNFGNFGWRTKIYNIDQNKIVKMYSKTELPLGPGYSRYITVSNTSKYIFKLQNNYLWLYNAVYETTSVDNPDNEEPLLISPNPATDFIEISVGANGRSPLQSDVMIYDVLGQNYDLTPALSINGEGVKIDVSGLVPGMYFVRIGDKVIKFVKI